MGWQFHRDIYIAELGDAEYAAEWWAEDGTVYLEKVQLGMWKADDADIRKIMTPSEYADQVAKAQAWFDIDGFREMESDEIANAGDARWAANIRAELFGPHGYAEAAE